ncbi:uncharacterized protein TNCV_4679031 [Trichonephila clavipes]|nr:uncharacterized protein TNCV_4679031 [Trichonephila clavipes]
MKCNSYQPSCADVSTDVKDDKERQNRDAITQTTPVPLSRSSSFTCVTECGCSENSPNSESDESLVLSGCSNCKDENINKRENMNSSSSSLDLSSDGDECVSLHTTPGSGASSLYLSACSGSSDSFEEATLALVIETPFSDYVKFPVERERDDFDVSIRQLRSSEATLRGSTLGDISEEQVCVTSETISMRSNISYPSLTDSSTVDPQSASFPSTLKTSRKNRFTGSPAQPIEPTVLVINDLNLKSVSAPVLLRQKRHVASTKTPESSSSDSSPPTGTRSKKKDSVGPKDQVPTRAHSAKELNDHRFSQMFSIARFGSCAIKSHIHSLGHIWKHCRNVCMLLPNLTEKWRGVIVDSMGTTNHRRTWGHKPRLVGGIVQSCGRVAHSTADTDGRKSGRCVETNPVC